MRRVGKEEDLMTESKEKITEQELIDAKKWFEELKIVNIKEYNIFNK